MGPRAGLDGRTISSPLGLFLTRIFYFVLHEFYTGVNIVLCVQGLRYYWMLLSYVLSLPPESYGNWEVWCALLL